MNNILNKPSLSAELIDLPPKKYVIIENITRAESLEAQNAIKALYILTEKIKSQANILKDHYNYDILPLEGIWRLVKKEIGFKEHPKNLIGKFMIEHPSYITEEFFYKIKEEAINENEDEIINIYLESSNLNILSEGKTVQILHKGPYHDEATSFNKIEMFLNEHNLSRKNIYHREIYLQDIRTATEENYETILRCEVI